MIPENNPNCDPGIQNYRGVSVLPDVAVADLGFESVVEKSGTFASIPVLARILQWSDGTWRLECKSKARQIPMMGRSVGEWRHF